MFVRAMSASVDSNENLNYASNSSHDSVFDRGNLRHHRIILQSRQREVVDNQRSLVFRRTNLVEYRSIPLLVS